MVSVPAEKFENYLIYFEKHCSLLEWDEGKDCHLALTANLLILYNDFLCQLLLELATKGLSLNGSIGFKR